MISNEEIKARLMSLPKVEYVDVEGDGYHYELTIVSDAFQGKRKVARQQWIYGHLKDFITSGTLHAVSMTTWTKEEWENQHG